MTGYRQAHRYVAPQPARLFSLRGVLTVLAETATLVLIGYAVLILLALAPYQQPYTP
jgi:hypothetical protein